MNIRKIGQIIFYAGSLVGVFALVYYLQFSFHKKELQLDKAAEEEQKSQQPEFATDQLLIKFKTDSKSKIKSDNYNDTGISDLNTFFKKNNVKEFKKLRGPRSLPVTDKADKEIDSWYLVKFKDSRLNKNISTREASLAQFKEVKRKFLENPDIETVEPNYKFKTQQTILNDPYLSSSGSWGQTYADLWGLTKIKAPFAWSKSEGEGVVVAVIDSGVDFGHEDIGTNIWTNPAEVAGNNTDDDNNGYIDDVRGWDFTQYDGSNPDSDPTDDNGHGTHVAGTIAAVGNNGLGIVGVAPKAKIMALKGINQQASGWTTDLAEAIVYAADNGASVINASWGMQVTDSSEIPILIKDAIDYAHNQKDVTVVTAAGNSTSSTTNFYPANFRNVITVGASDSADQRSSFSNYGVRLDVLAPGSDILSLLASGTNPPQGNIVGTNYLRSDGTSMAAPHVAGLAALIKSAHSAWDTEQIRQIITKNADNLYSAGVDLDSGYGRINTEKALNDSAVPLRVHLTAPVGQTINVDTIAVRGYAYGDSFKSWKLEYADTDSLGIWNTIITSDQPKTANSLLANLSGATLSDGEYIIRLTGETTDGRKYSDKTNISFSRMYITSPAFADQYNNVVGIYNSDSIDIKGTVAMPGFKNYTIQVLKDSNREPITANITLVNGGLQKVRDGLLATWNTQGVPANKYIIEITEHTTNPNISPIVEVAVIFDRSVHQGWPKSLEQVTNGMLQLSAFGHMQTADVNNDGKHDLLLGYGERIMILDGSGNSLPGWPVSLSPDGNCYFSGSPAAADLNKDGKREIVYTACNKLWVWNSEGVLLPGYPAATGNTNSLLLGLEDLDADGSREVIYAEFGDFSESTIKVVDINNQPLPGWPVRIAEYTEPFGSSIGDFNHDGKKEIVIIDSDSAFKPYSKIYVLKHDGTAMNGWPKVANQTTGNYVGDQPILADLNNDMDLELIVETTGNKLFAYNHNGTTVSGWPINLLSPITSFAVGDIDADRKIEVAIGDATDKLHVYRANGQLYPNWPKQMSGQRLFQNRGITGLAIVDIDDDAKGDIISSNFFVRNLLAHRYDGTVIAGFPKFSFHPHLGVPAIADVDGDGLLEMATVDDSANVSVYDLEGRRRSQPLSWPMYLHDSQRTSAIKALTAVSTPTPISTPTTCVQVKPSVEVLPTSQTVNAGGSISYKVVVRNNNPSICPKTNFTITASKPVSAWTVSLSSTTAELPSGQFITVFLTYNTTFSTPSNIFGVQVTAKNQQGLSGAGNASLNIISKFRN